MYDRRETDKTYFGTTLATLVSITMAGLSQRYAEAAPPTTTPVTLAFTDSGSSTDDASLRITRRLAFTDQGTSSDRAALSVTKYLSFTDAGTSSDLASLSVGSQPATVLLA